MGSSAPLALMTRKVATVFANTARTSTPDRGAEPGAVDAGAKSGLDFKKKRAMRVAQSSPLAEKTSVEKKTLLGQ